MRPKILFICTACPYAPSFGAQLRTLANATALRDLGDITTVMVTARDWGEEAIERTREELNLRAIITPIRTARFRLWERLRHEFDHSFMKVTGMEVRDEDRARLGDWIAEHDLVWVQRLEIANTIGIYKWPHTVIDLDDLRSEYFRGETQLKTGLGRLNAHRRALLNRRREKHLHHRFPVLVVCSEDDRRLLPAGANIHTVPNSFPMPDREPTFEPSAEPRLGFIGLLAYPPNRSGLEWFADRVWPLVRKQVPEAKLRIIGKGWEETGLARHPGFEGLGFVDDVKDEMASWHGMIVPVLFGAGTRVKVAEALSRKIPMVSTVLGAYGYSVSGGREVLLADDPAQFGAACIRLLGDPELGSALADRGWRLFEKEYSWNAVGGKIRAAAEDCLRLSRPGVQVSP